jgi:formamidopyrimidine-DNA glycosylase
MPEGPEVYIIAECLDSLCHDEIIKDIIIWKDSRYKSEDLHKFACMRGKKINAVSFKGKKLIFVFEDCGFMVSSLALEGKWKLLDTFNPEAKHVSVIFELESGKVLQFQDQRHFGDIRFYPDSKAMDLAFKDTVGISWIPSMMYPDDLTKDHFYHLLAKSKKPIVMFLVEQKYTSGIGNYIRSDALYLANISPHRKANSLSQMEADRLFDAVYDVIEKSIEAGGHTLRSYYDPIGKPGGYVPYVYGRSLSFPNKEPVTREVDSQKRSFFWVEGLQR